MIIKIDIRKLPKKALSYPDNDCVTVSRSIFLFLISLAYRLIDIFLCFLWGGVLSGFVNTVFIFSTRYLLASEATIFMLLEFALGPFWVWIFLNETISHETFFGGTIVMVSVAIYSIFEIINSKIKTTST